MDERRRMSKITELQLEVFDIKRGLKAIEAGAKKIEQDLKDLDQVMQKSQILINSMRGPQSKKSKVKIYTGRISRSVSESELDKLMQSI